MTMEIMPGTGALEVARELSPVVLVLVGARRAIVRALREPRIRARLLRRGGRARAHTGPPAAVDSDQSAAAGLSPACGFFVCGDEA